MSPATWPGAGGIGPPGPKGDPGPAGPAGPPGHSPNQGRMIWQTGPTNPPLPPGEMGAADPPPRDASAIILSGLDGEGASITDDIMTLSSGDHVGLEVVDNPDSWHTYQVTDAPTDDGADTYTIPVQTLAGSPPETAPIEPVEVIATFAFQGPKGDPGPAGGSLISGWWTYHDATTEPPGIGQLRTVVVSPFGKEGDQGILWLSNTDRNGLGWTFDAVAVGDQVLIRDTNGNRWNLVLLAKTAQPGYTTFEAEIVSGTADPPRKGTDVQIDFITTAAGSDANYVHTQGTPSDSWSVAHNLGKFVSVQVVDSGNTMVIPNVYYDSENLLTLSFGSPTTGKAYCN